MKILLFTLSFFFSLISFSSQTLADCTKILFGINGFNEFYIDLSKIRKHQGYSYYWELINNYPPNKHGLSSSIAYYKVDCNVFKAKQLNSNFYSGEMGTGNIILETFEEKKWRYPQPNTNLEKSLKVVCNN